MLSDIMRQQCRLIIVRLTRIINLTEIIEFLDTRKFTYKNAQINYQNTIQPNPKKH